MILLRRTVVSLLLCCLALAPQAVWAQDVPELQLQQFRPAGGPADYLNTYSSAVAPHLEFDMGAWADFADDPLKVPSFNAAFNPVVESQSTLSLFGNFGLFDMFEIGLLLPVTLLQSSADLSPVLDEVDPGAEISKWSINDPRISVKYMLLNLLKDPLGLGFVLNGTIPVGLDDRFSGDQSFSLEALTTAEVWVVRGIRVAANLGYRYRNTPVNIRDNVIGDQLRWALATNIPLFIKTLDAILEFDGGIGVAAKEEGREGIRPGEVPAEVKVAARLRIHEDWAITGGLGGAMNKEAVGTPDVRFFLGVSGHWVSGGQWGFDYDGDGIYGVHDKCPNDPEDFDGHEDTDGCPDPDNDGDGVPDEFDQCDNTPEGVEVGADGCPDNDLDGDGIPNDLDKCPEDPEDIDGFEDSDGCPDIDNDQDGIPDAADNCPNKPETFNDFLDDDGCPDDPNDKVHISRDRIIITEQVHFETAKAKIKRESYPILDAVIEVMKENPQILKIRVEGHTDSRGSDEYNLELSDDRAESVMNYLVENGIAENRLESVGYGETKPIKDNETAAGRAANRRVEFTILEMREY